MKKKLLNSMRMLLVAAGLLVGANAWAVPTYTWDFTNTTTWTTAKVSTGSAVTLNPSGETPGAGEYGITFNFTSEKGAMKWNAASKSVSGTGLWFYSNGSATSECISINVPAGFKVTFNFIGGNLSGRPFVCSTDGGTTSSNKTSSPYQYSNETTSDVTVVMWASNCLNSSSVSQNCITSVVLEDFSAVASHTWSAKAYATISGVKTEIGSWNGSGAEYNEGESYNVWANKVIEYNGHYYELNDAKFATNAVYFNTTMGDDDAEHEITYTQNDDIAFFTECEDWYDTQNTNSLIASNGVYVHYYTGTHNVSITDAGVYRMETNVLSRGSDSGLSVYDSEDNELGGFYRTGTGFKQTAAFYLPASSTIKVGRLSANTAGIDYVLIRKVSEVGDAISLCKANETSAAFATYIDNKYAAGELLSASQVYAAHTAWQLDNASSDDLTKVIINADFGTGNLAPWNIYGDAAATGDTDNNKYGAIEDNGAGGYQYYTGWNGRNVSQNIVGLPAGVYRLTARVYSWSGGAPVKLFANGTISAEENGEDHEPSLEFTVSGSEESVKIGVGGVGQGSGDNTWGTWGYRVNYFTLTKVTVPVSVTAVGYATLCPTYNLDFSAATAIEACKASVAADGKITYTKVNTVKAGEGVLLRSVGGAAANENIPAIASATLNEDNAFVGITTEQKLAQTADGCTNYILANGASGIGFYKVNTNGSWVKAGTAYLKVAPSAAREFFSLDDETTGISATLMNSEESTVNSVFDLQGRRVAAPQKGLYIVNGKKVVIK